MSSKVQICNLALTKLGAARITSLSDNTIEAKLCNTLYDDIADEVMASGEWSSTINRVTLNATENTPAYGFTNEFQLPTDPFCLRVLSIDEENVGDEQFRIEGDKLLANISTMKIRYIGRIEDTQSYDEMLKRTIVARLAYELAYPLTGQTSVSNLMYQTYIQVMNESLAIDGKQGSNEATQSYDLDQVR